MRQPGFNPRTHVGCDFAQGLSHVREHIVSIHAPTWGATDRPFPIFLRAKSFNPRTHVGCDIIHYPTIIRKILVSIHAPTWGATANFSQNARATRVSIHAPTWGATLMQAPPQRSGVFQSTHPRGVRPYRYGMPTAYNLVSIHAPTWGATASCPGSCHMCQVSIHAPTWGATIGP